MTTLLGATRERPRGRGTSRNARDHSARSPQPRHETMFPSTTAAPSTYSPPASSMSGASGPKPDERRPRRSPSAAGTCGPWQSVPTGLSSSKKCSTIRRTSGSTRMNSGARPPGITTAAKLAGSTSANATSTGHVRPGLLDVRVPLRLEVVDDELDRARRRRRDVRLVARLDEPVLHEHRLQVFGRVTGQDQHLRHRRRGYSTVTVLARFRGWSTFRPRRRAIL